LFVETPIGRVPVRPATPEDVSRIAEIARETWHTAYDDLLGAETVDALIDEWYASDRLEDDVAGTPHYFVAERERERDEDGESGGDGDGANEVVGYVAGSTGAEERPPGQAVLGAIYVRPGCWGQGVGSRLLERFAASVADDGAGEIAAVVLAGNEVGRSFYDRHGFETVERREEVLGGEPVEELVVAADVATLR
jgi:ribosomal protein S18 acetylase RimI-like enzyme